jgi:hypothetical protein
MHINITWASSLNSPPAGLDVTSFESTIRSAANYLQSQFTDNVTINLTIGINGSLGIKAAETTNTYLNISYSDLRAALQSRAFSADDNSAMANLPQQSDPLTSLDPSHTTYVITRAEAKAIGYNIANTNDSTQDAAINFSTGLNWDYTHTLSTVNANHSDLFSAALHEFTEAMGRALYAGSSGHDYTPYDLFDYSQASRLRDITGTDARFFSIDGGSTALDNFNNIPGQDFGDWDFTAGTDTATYGPPGEQYALDTLSPADRIALDVLGWRRASITDDFANSLTPSSAPIGQVSPGTAIIGTLETKGDRDWLSVQLSAGHSYSIDVLGAGHVHASNGTLSDSFVYLHNNTGVALATNDDGGADHNSEIQFTPTSAGLYYIEVGSYADTYMGDYRVVVTEIPHITSNGAGASATIQVSENSTAVTTVTGTDQSTATLQFSLSGADAASFNIDRNTGTLTFRSAPNFESPGSVNHSNIYQVQVTASDPGAPVDTGLARSMGWGDVKFTTSQSLTINVNDLPEAPTITSNGGGDTATLSIPENSTTVTTVTASDPDAGATLTYSLVTGADSAKFQISQNGALSFITAPDYESQTHSSSYVVGVKVTDNTGLSDIQTLTVNVTNVNEYAPVITSGFGGDVANYLISNRTTAVTQVAATDRDAGTTITYSLYSGDDMRFFQINSSTGVLSFISPPDHSQPNDSNHDNIYLVIVRAWDGTPFANGVLYDEQAINVSVSGADTPPTITSNGGGDVATIAVPENTTSVTTVTATDPDPGTTFSYSLSGGADQARFQINPTTGVLSFVSPPDFENPADSDHNNSYVVQVIASDGTFSDAQVITVNVTDVPGAVVTGNDNANNLTGTPENDTITALGGNDILNSGRGNDILDGGLGIDTAVFAGNRSAYTLSHIGTKLIVTGPDGTDTLTNIEKLQFSDVTVSVRPHASDFNGDGFGDVLLRDASGNLWVNEYNGVTIVSSGPAGAPAANWDVVGVADFNGDGRSDVALRDQTSGQLWFNLYNGTTITGSGSGGFPSTDWDVVGTGDFNADGMSDILLRNHASGQLWFNFYSGTNIIGSGSGGFPTTNWDTAGIGDFNNDGYSDVLLRDHATGQLWINFYQGANIVGSGPAGSPSTDWDMAGIGDFNGDGYSDVMLRNHASGQLWINLYNGANIVGSGPAGSPTTDWDVARIADYNGDGYSDVMLRNHASGQLWVNFYNGVSLIGGGSAGSPTTDWHFIGV